MSKSQIVHLGFMVFWVLMAIPVLTVWQESILLVLIMSLYANIEASATAYLSANPKKKPTRKRLHSTNMPHGQGSMKNERGRVRLVRSTLR